MRGVAPLSDDAQLIHLHRFGLLKNTTIAKSKRVTIVVDARLFES